MRHPQYDGLEDWAREFVAKLQGTSAQAQAVAKSQTHSAAVSAYGVRKAAGKAAGELVAGAGSSAGRASAALIQARREARKAAKRALIHTLIMNNIVALTTLAGLYVGIKYATGRKKKGRRSKKRGK